MPFGGVSESGMGHYHGYEGFLTFSKLRPVFRQARWASTKMLMPPYGQLAEQVLGFLSRQAMRGSVPYGWPGAPLGRVGPADRTHRPRPAVD